MTMEKYDEDDVDDDANPLPVHQAVKNKAAHPRQWSAIVACHSYSIP